MILAKSDEKKYVKLINRFYERTAASILKRRARQGDVVAVLLIDNNPHTDMLARYQSSSYEPVSHEEAMETPDKEKWGAAEKVEIQSLIKNKVFQEEDKPSNRKLIPGKWIYKRKKFKSGTVEKFKARVFIRFMDKIFMRLSVQWPD